jgi:hypothetical protein
LSEVAFVEDSFFLKVNLHALQLLQATVCQLTAKIALFGDAILEINGMQNCFAMALCEKRQ